MDLKKFKFKFNKMKMENLENALDHIDYDKIKPKKIQKRKTPYGKKKMRLQ